MATVASVDEALAIADWRRCVAVLYQELRCESEPLQAWRHWCETRDALFAGHAASPLPPIQRPDFAGLCYYPYDPSLRLQAALEQRARAAADLPVSAPLQTRFVAVADAVFTLDGPRRLTVYWLDDYAGGLLIAFRDRTSGPETYQSGRYLVDTGKGADPGLTGSQCVLDFNFAYNPSCSYDPAWACPLAPSQNWLGVAIRAGERLAGPAHPRSGASTS